MKENPSYKEILEKAKSLIDTPDKWTKGRYAATKDGDTVLISNPDACRFCASGAVVRALWELRIKGATHWDTLNEILITNTPVKWRAQNYWDMGPVPFNDNDKTTHRQIMNMFNRAIKSLSAKKKKKK